MAPTNGRLTRRNVLKTTGAGVASLAGVGVASASSFSIGDCAVTIDNAEVWFECGGDKIDEVPPDLQGTVQDTCVSGWSEVAFVDWETTGYHAGWVYANNLDHC